MSISPTKAVAEKKLYWWLGTRKVAEKYVREARVMIETRDSTQVNAALSLLDSALARSPRFELALKLKARCLLHLRRFREVADMLQHYIPSHKAAAEDESSGSPGNSSLQLSRERVKLLHSFGDSPGFRCFSVSELKRKVLAGLCMINSENESHWRYSVLGQACCHLGLMEDAMVLLQTGKRLATAAFRRESICWSDDSFSSNTHLPLPAVADDATITTQTIHHRRRRQTSPSTELQTTTLLLSEIKLLLRRRAAAIAALDAGLYTQSIRHFSKILDGRRPAPQAFLSECYLHRSAAYRAAGGVAESIADCNRALALDPSFIRALEARASLFELIGCIADALHDLEHLKLLFNSVLRDRNLPGLGWKPQAVRYRDVPGKLCVLTGKIQQLKQLTANGEKCNVDFYKLMGLRRGCSRSELERAYLLLVIRHKPDKAVGFIDRCELVNSGDHESVRDRARLSAVLLYRLIQKGHNALMAEVQEEEAAEERRKAAQAIHKTAAIVALQQPSSPEPELRPEKGYLSSMCKLSGSDRDGVREHNVGLGLASGPYDCPFQKVFCRDLAVVGSLLSQVGFDRPLSVK